MAFKSIGKMQDGLKDLWDQAEKLERVFAENGDENDWGQLGRIRDRLFGLDSLICAEWHMANCLIEISDIDDAAEPKFTFIAEKSKNQFVKLVLFVNVENLLDISRNWKFADYRAINFQNDLRRTMEDIRKRYKERYDL